MQHRTCTVREKVVSPNLRHLRTIETIFPKINTTISKAIATAGRRGIAVTTDNCPRRLTRERSWSNFGAAGRRCEATIRIAATTAARRHFADLRFSVCGLSSAVLPRAQAQGHFWLYSVVARLNLTSYIPLKTFSVTGSWVECGESEESFATGLIRWKRARSRACEKSSPRFEMNAYM